MSCHLNNFIKKQSFIQDPAPRNVDNPTIEAMDNNKTINKLRHELEKNRYQNHFQQKAVQFRKITDSKLHGMPMLSGKATTLTGKSVTKKSNTLPMKTTVPGKTMFPPTTLRKTSVLSDSDIESEMTTSQSSSLFLQTPRDQISDNSSILDSGLSGSEYNFYNNSMNRPMSANSDRSIETTSSLSTNSFKSNLSLNSNQSDEVLKNSTITPENCHRIYQTIYNQTKKREVHEKKKNLKCGSLDSQNIHNFQSQNLQTHNIQQRHLQHRQNQNRQNPASKYHQAPIQKVQNNKILSSSSPNKEKSSPYHFISPKVALLSPKTHKLVKQFDNLVIDVNNTSQSSCYSSVGSSFLLSPKNVDDLPKRESGICPLPELSFIDAKRTVMFDTFLKPFLTFLYSF